MRTLILCFLVSLFGCDEDIDPNLQVKDAAPTADAVTPDVGEDPDAAVDPDMGSLADAIVGDAHEPDALIVDVGDEADTRLEDAAEPDSGVDMDAGEDRDGAVDIDGAIDFEIEPDGGPAPLCNVALSDDGLVADWWGRGPSPSWEVEILRASPEGCDLLLDTASDWLRVAVVGDRLILTTVGLPAGRNVGQLVVGDAILSIVVNVFLDPPEATRKVLVIGVDGLRSDALEAVPTPNIDRLRAGGASTFEASTQLTGTTFSGPGWTSILTGVETDKHQVRDNINWLNIARQYPTLLKRARDLGFQTSASVQWAPIAISLLEADATDWRRAHNNHDSTVADAVAQLGAGHDVHFVHLDDVDHAGHATGFSAENPEYRHAIETIDDGVGQMIEAVLRRREIQTESWLILLTTDHGGEGNSHGALDRANRRIPLIVAGAAAQPGDTGPMPSHLDVYPTAMAFLGYPTDPSWGLDGHAIALDFEALCDDAVDDDGDGDVDCADPDCLPLCDLACPEAARDLGGATGAAVVQGNTNAAEDQGGGACGGAGAGENGYAWTAPRAGRYVFQTVGADYDTVLYAVDDECRPVACNDHIHGSARIDVPISDESGFWLELAAEDALVLVVDGAGETGEFALNIFEQAAVCADALDLGSEVGRVADGNSNGRATRLDASCGGLSGDIVFRWRAPAAGVWRFDTTGSFYDTMLVLKSEDCTEELACNDDGVGLQSAVERELAEGEVLTVVVGGFRGRSGAYVLNISAQ